LLLLIAKADPDSRARLAAGFPRQVAAWEIWTHVGLVGFKDGSRHLTAAQLAAALALVPVPGGGTITDMRTAPAQADPSPGLALGRVLEAAGAQVVILGSCDFGRPSWSEHLSVTLPDGTELDIDAGF